MSAKTREKIVFVLAFKSKKYSPDWCILRHDDYSIPATCGYWCREGNEREWSTCEYDNRIPVALNSM